MQSALDEQLDTTGDFHSRDPKWLSVLYQRLRAKARGKAPFVVHERLDDFRFSLSTASYFNAANRYWQIVGLDSAYVNHHISTEQQSWFGAQLVGGARTILLTHHHLLSPFRKRGDALEKALDPHLASCRVYAWFWGHEHHLLEFTDYRGVKCRCIGHGSLPYVPPDQRRRRHPAEIVRMETRPSPLNPARGMHGFAQLRFDGPALHIEYIDEEGGTAWDERWE